MSKRVPVKQSSDSDSDIGRKVEEELSSDDDIKDKPKKQAPARKRVRLPLSRRTEIIQNKQRGYDDPEYCCTQNPKTKTWIVRKRKFPLDQTHRHDEPLPLKKEVVVEEEVKEPVKEEKKDDLQLSWANMQASKNDGLTKQLSELSAKFDKLAEKYEKKKIAKAMKAQPKEAPKPKFVPAPEHEEYEYYTDEEEEKPPETRGRPATAPRQTPGPAAQIPIPQRVFAGQYRRAAPISIAQF
jgi:hypothetical protein